MAQVVISGVLVHDGLAALLLGRSEAEPHGRRALDSPHGGHDAEKDRGA
jgi:hypothetical protein